MRVVVVGGGPSGLYFALLLKKADPSHHVTVLERNAPDATFGWGVVFSEETLGAFRDADRESHQAIIDSFASWGSIDVHYGGDVVRSRGHAFSGIARTTLLQILQHRCAELGVELRFREEIADPTELAGFDLVVSADGVNSVTRTRQQDAFRPSLDVHRSKFVWFGTSRVFDAFTFIFRETEHGMFQVHAYPFDAATSTFIVETTEDTWRRAGLDTMSEEESIAFCQRMFAPELDGHELLSNRSIWISFVTVRCETWHHHNVVLLGDAAHTAHFTIGSGTKLAMEDAIALAEAVVAEKDLEAALVGYEMARQPVVDRFQEAARESATYFESVSRYRSFEPMQFAFNLLTRSGRITHLELERRDPAFVARVDRWFAGRPEATLPARPLHARLSVRGVELADRVASTTPGFGLVLTEVVAVSPEGRISPDSPTIETWKRPPGSRLCLQLGHAGRRGAARPRREGVDIPLRDDGWPLLSASALPYTRRSAVPKEMDSADMDGVLEAFVEAARTAGGLGADAIEVNAAQGYLLASFLSPLTNRRSDEHGGSLQNRMRYPLQVLEAVRDAWAGPLVVRLTATDWAPGGIEPDDAVAVARAARDVGCDIVHVSAGQTVPYDRPVYGRMFLAQHADRIRNEAGIATMVGGAITTADEIDTILAAGRADLCVLDPRLYTPIS